MALTLDIIANTQQAQRGVRAFQGTVDRATAAVLRQRGTLGDTELALKSLGFTTRNDAIKQVAALGTSFKSGTVPASQLRDKAQELHDRFTRLGVITPELSRELQNYGARTNDVTQKSSKFAGVLKTAVGTALGFLSARAIPAVISTIGNLISRTGEVNALEGAFNNMASAVGLSSQSIIQGLRPATLGLVDDMELMRLTNNALALGIVDSEQQWVKLAGAATKLGRAVGLDAAFALESLSTGLGRQSKLVLDNLGVTFRLSEAYDEYAQSIGKTVAELTDAEKKEAFLAKATDAIITKAEQAGDANLVLSDRLKRISVNIDNLVTDWARLANAQDGFFAGLFDNLDKATRPGKGTFEALITAQQQGSQSTWEWLGFLQSLGNVMGQGVTPATIKATTETAELNREVVSSAGIVKDAASQHAGLHNALMNFKDAQELARLEAIEYRNSIENMDKAIKALGFTTQQDALGQIEQLDFAIRSGKVPVQQLEEKYKDLRNTFQDLGVWTPEVQAAMERLNGVLPEMETDAALLRGRFLDMRMELGKLLPEFDKTAEGIDKMQEASTDFVVGPPKDMAPVLKKQAEEAKKATGEFVRFFDVIRTGVQWVDNLIGAVVRFIASLVGGSGLTGALKSAAGSLGGLLGGLAGGRTGGIVGNLIGGLLGGGIPGLGGAGAAGAAGGAGGLLGLLGIGGGGFQGVGAGVGVGVGGGAGAGGLLAGLGSKLAALFTNPLTAIIGGGAIGLGFLLKAIFKKADAEEQLTSYFSNLRVSDSVQGLIDNTNKSLGDLDASVRVHLGQIISGMDIGSVELGQIITQVNQIFSSFDLGNLSATQTTTAFGDALVALIPKMAALGQQGQLQQQDVQALGTAWLDMLHRVELGHFSVADAQKVVDQALPLLQQNIGAFGVAGQDALDQIIAKLNELGFKLPAEFQNAVDNAKPALEDLRATAENKALAIQFKLSEALKNGADPKIIEALKVQLAVQLQEIARIGGEQFQALTDEAIISADTIKGGFRLAVGGIVNDFQYLKKTVVGASIVPDMVDEIGDEWRRMGMEHAEVAREITGHWIDVARARALANAEQLFGGDWAQIEARGRAWLPDHFGGSGDPLRITGRDGDDYERRTSRAVEDGMKKAFGRDRGGDGEVITLRFRGLPSDIEDALERMVSKRQLVAKRSIR